MTHQSKEVTYQMGALLGITEDQCGRIQEIADATGRSFNDVWLDDKALADAGIHLPGRG
jgi:lactam utilization protein B